MTKVAKMMADRRLALGTEVGAELGHIAFFFAQEHQHRHRGGVGDLLEQFGDWRILAVVGLAQTLRDLFRLLMRLAWAVRHGQIFR